MLVHSKQPCKVDIGGRKIGICPYYVKVRQGKVHWRIRISFNGKATWLEMQTAPGSIRAISINDILRTIRAWISHAKTYRYSFSRWRANHGMSRDDLIKRVRFYDWVTDNIPAEFISDVCQKLGP